MRTSETGAYGGNDERVLVLLPQSRDAESIPLMLGKIGVASLLCATSEEICSEIDKGAGALLVAETVLSDRTKEYLMGALDGQPPWSELPIIVLLRHGPETKVGQDALLLPGDVTLVEQPVRVSTLVALIRSALRSRRRQYLVRDYLQALEVSEMRYRTLFDSIDEGFCVIEMIFDQNGKPTDFIFLETNPSFEKLTGLLNVQGKKIRELVPNHEEQWYEIYGRVALTGEPVRFERLAKQLQRWFDLYAFRFGPPGNRQVALLFSDITERKRTELEIAGLNTDLMARTADLEIANRNLEAFNYTVAHDLRQPLNLLNSYCQVIDKMFGDQLPEECKGYVRDAYKTTLRMDRLIEALLNFSRLAHVEPRRETVNLSALAHEVAQDLKLAQPERQVDFRIADDIVGFGDGNLLRVVLHNLIGNAWKYTGSTEEASIEFGATEIDEKQVYFVKDNGPGFDKAGAEKLFVPFQRLPGAAEFRGFGIGLATVERIIQRHGGKVWAEGEPKKGATFFFTLSTS